MTKSSDRLFTPEVIGVAVAFVLGAVLTILDATIVNVAVPVLARDLHVSISTIQWVPTIYLLSFAAVIPVSGWATERYGANGSGSPRLRCSSSDHFSARQHNRSVSYSSPGSCRASVAVWSCRLVRRCSPGSPDRTGWAG